MDKEPTDMGMERFIRRFPEHAWSIQQRFREDQGFREMCGDYAEALEALQGWKASDAPHKAARVEEYREVVGGLEVELVTALRLPSLA